MSKNIFLCLTISIFFTGCFTTGSRSELVKIHYDEVQQEEVKKINPITEFDFFIGKKTGNDCSGFVEYVNKKYDNIFYNHKKLKNHYDKTKRRSKAIYNLLKSQNKISNKKAKVGDLIFFANTTKKYYKKPKGNENITHLGIITSIDTDSTIEFVHLGTNYIKKDYMNLTDKGIHKNNEKILNSFIIKCKNRAIGCLTSDRFAAFGKTAFSKSI